MRRDCCTHLHRPMGEDVCLDGSHVCVDLIACTEDMSGLYHQSSVAGGVGVVGLGGRSEGWDVE